MLSYNLYDDDPLILYNNELAKSKHRNKEHHNETLMRFLNLLQETALYFNYKRYSNKGEQWGNVNVVHALI